jgi:hypothetical protein
MLFKNSVRTSKRTPHFTITKINWLTLFKFNMSFELAITTSLSLTLKSHSKSKKKEISPAKRHGCAWGERRYSSYSFTTSALDGGEWSASRPGRALPPGKGPPVPIVQEAGWAAEPVWTQRLEEKYFSPAGDRTPFARSSSP